MQCHNVWERRPGAIVGAAPRRDLRPEAGLPQMQCHDLWERRPGANVDIMD